MSCSCPEFRTELTKIVLTTCASPSYSTRSKPLKIRNVPLRGKVPLSNYRFGHEARLHTPRTYNNPREQLPREKRCAEPSFSENSGRDAGCLGHENEQDGLRNGAKPRIVCAAPGACRGSGIPRSHRPAARPCRTERTLRPLKPGWSEAPYFAALAVASISIIMPGQASAVMTRNVPAGCVTPPNSSVLHLPAGKK
jgi:hypothetical protein